MGSVTEARRRYYSFVVRVAVELGLTDPDPGTGGPPPAPTGEPDRPAAPPGFEFKRSRAGAAAKLTSPSDDFRFDSWADVAVEIKRLGIDTRPLESDGDDRE